MKLAQSRGFREIRSEEAIGELLGVLIPPLLAGPARNPVGKSQDPSIGRLSHCLLLLVYGRG